MPTDPAILVFSNRWYPAACATATWVEIDPGLSIRLVTAPLFVATKLEAFSDRDGGDLFGSRDIEDVVALIDGRPELAAGVGEAPPEVRAYLVAAELDELDADAAPHSEGRELASRYELLDLAV